MFAHAEHSSPNVTAYLLTVLALASAIAVVVYLYRRHR